MNVGTRTNRALVEGAEVTCTANVAGGSDLPRDVVDDHRVAALVAEHKKLLALSCRLVGFYTNWPELKLTCVTD